MAKLLQGDNGGEKRKCSAANSNEKYFFEKRSQQPSHLHFYLDTDDSQIFLQSKLNL